ncbi:M15 family peptidase [Agrobacterium sp. FDAARGOS_525]|uniref:M15 family metallopeptidase n=1 Tax=Agrobacterium sp. FDAARGOS_525 TaxID=2420311 RepID=UPI000F68BFF8|nr:M15 family metallopeptidase [Agrobacterium sp. FDAARGOS_525]RSC37359.1 M15 family peptidase [Agrobacterium sp. FDAARGOS_525]
MGYVLSQRSLARLEGVHPDLVRIVQRAIQITEIDFVVTEGVRTLEKQKDMVARGASKTMNSRHLKAANGYSHAVDLAALVGGSVVWDWPLYAKLAKAMKQAAKELGIPLEWGGDWKSFKDGPHFQLPWKQYPSAGPVAGKKYTAETETQAKSKALAILGGGVSTAVPVGQEPLTKAVEVVSAQQGELSSGEWARMAIAVFIVGISVYLAWRKL